MRVVRLMTADVRRELLELNARELASLNIGTEGLCLVGMPVDPAAVAFKTALQSNRLLQSIA